MIGRLVGRIVEVAADGSAVLDVAGVGYEVTTPLGALGRAEAAEGGAVTLYVHTHVREDALQLFGFSSRDERAAFRMLISIPNVGPKIGMAILGAFSPSELAGAIAAADTARLTKVPGVGKRTAERIVLELKGKLLVSSAPQASSSAPRMAVTAKSELLHGALTNLGFKGAEAERAIAALGPRVESDPMGDLVRSALSFLSH